MWQDEDMDLLVSYATKPPSPVYSRRKGDPMGVSSSTSAGGKKKLSQENLGVMFPCGERGSVAVTVQSQALTHTYTHCR